MYVTTANLADRPGATELAEVATPTRDAIVAADLMDATLRGTDRSAWTADLTAIADAALANITQAIDDAGTLIDGFLGGRYAVPVDATQFGIVRVWATAITRYLLHKDRHSMEATDPVVRDYKDALKLLQMAQNGQFSLGAGDPAAATGTPDYRAGDALVDADTMTDYSNGMR